MAKHSLKIGTAYVGASIVLTTKHAKSLAIAQPFQDKLLAKVLEHVADTDKLGTFSGEVKREVDALECARKKCEWAFEKLGDKVEFALASEGCFGPHPLIPFIPCDYEILYFIDRKRDFYLYVSHLSQKTNYRTKVVGSLNELQKFAQDSLFPSHALILRASVRGESTGPIFKGIDSQVALEEAFQECLRYASDGKVWVETDMRAQFNPLRMGVIRELAIKLAERLATHCPGCDLPGWGKVRDKKGLECSWCASETEMIKLEVFGCVKCDYEEIAERLDGLKQADPGECQYCNP